jgi:hypothetical protein
MNVTELAHSNDCRIGSLGPVLITVLYGEGTYAVLDLIDATQTAFVRDHPKLISMTVIASPKLSAKLPPDFRERSAALQRKFDNNLLATAVVIQSRGIVAVIARAFMAAYELVAQARAPRQTFRNIGDAVTWIGTLNPEAKAIAGAAEAVELFVREKLPAPR